MVLPDTLKPVYFTNNVRKMKTPFISVFFSLGIWLALSCVTSADIIDTYGFSAKNMGKGGAVCASVDGGSSVFYNPAGLGQTTGIEMGTRARIASCVAECMR